MLTSTTSANSRASQTLETPTFVSRTRIIPPFSCTTVRTQHYLSYLQTSASAQSLPLLPFHLNLSTNLSTNWWSFYAELYWNLGQKELEESGTHVSCNDFLHVIIASKDTVMSARITTFQQIFDLMPVWISMSCVKQLLWKKKLEAYFDHHFRKQKNIFLCGPLISFFSGQSFSFFDLAVL